jgi:hypothetical protein
MERYMLISSSCVVHMAQPRHATQTAQLVRSVM